MISLEKEIFFCHEQKEFIHAEMLVIRSVINNLTIHPYMNRRKVAYLLIVDDKSFRMRRKYLPRLHLIRHSYAVVQMRKWLWDFDMRKWENLIWNKMKRWKIIEMRIIMNVEGASSEECERRIRSMIDYEEKFKKFCCFS